MKLIAKIHLIAVLAMAVSVVNVGLAQDEAPPESRVLQDAAANLQNDEKFELAVEQWTKLIEQFPTTSSTNLWRYHLGICQEKIGDHVAAIDAFEKVLSAAPADFPHVQECWLHLGYSQWMHAKRLAATPDKSNEVKERASAAAGSFSSLLEKFPESKFADQAVYFLGEANVTAEQLDKAIAAFDRLVLEMPDSKFWPDAVYALGSCHEERGDFEKALVNYDRYIEKSPQGRQVDEVRFRKAEALLQFGLVAEKAGDKKTAVGRYDEAEKLYGQVAQAKDFADRSIAAYQRAVALARTDQFALAAAAFAQFAIDFPTAESASLAMIAAGQNYLRANDLASAEKQLSAALEKDPKSVSAAHWLCRTHLAAQQPAKAWSIAEKTRSQIDAKSPEAAQLLMDQADAAFVLPEKVAESVPLYRQLVEQFPQHPLAPQALYNAGFSSLVAKQPDRTIELAEQFYAAFKDDTFLPDVLEIHAEAALQKQQWDVAEKLYRQLVTDYPKNKKSTAWQSGLVQTLMLGGKNDDAINAASPLVDQLDGRAQAELLFHLGSAQFQTGEFEPALASLNRALQADATWARADEAKLLAARAEFRAGRAEKAIERAEKCASDHPQSAIRDQIYFRLGEFNFEQGKFDQAIRYYSNVIDEFPKSQYVASAWYGRGWSELRQNKAKEAVASFDTLLEKFPEHTLVADATLARGLARRRGGSLPEAAADLDRFIATNPPEAEKLEALYERALVEVDQKQYDAVIEKFQALLKLASDPAAAKQWGDKCYYELAWAHKAKNDAEKSIATFAELVEKFPASPLAAEAQFHLGEAAYEADDFAKAAGYYAAAQDSAKNDAELREKASYKLAWTHYKKQDYAAAEKVFRQQLVDFPQGLLKADGLFMVSESLFRQKQHVAAVTAYKAALPEVQASQTVREDVKMLTLLHGAQSANEAKQYSEAIAFLKPIVEAAKPPANYAAEAWFEFGQAHKGNGDAAKAIEAWGKAQDSFDKTGVRARCMIAEALFEDKKFDEAIKEFTLAVYGYGGRDAADSVKPWQAFAAYELARCNLVQISSAEAAARPQLIQEAKTWFMYLVEHYPDDKLTNEAKNQIDKLNKM